MAVRSTHACPYRDMAIAAGAAAVRQGIVCAASTEGTLAKGRRRRRRRKSAASALCATAAIVALDGGMQRTTNLVRTVRISQPVHY